MLRADELRSALVGPYAAVDVVETTGSTNADLVAAVDAADRTVLIAGAQTAGRGRRAREWVSPPSGLYLSVLLRPSVPAARLGTLAMVAGLALVHTARGAGVEATLKWPNDLLAPGGKLAGVLSEVAAPAVVVGIGLNVSPLGAVPAGPGALPATSLAEAGATTTDRTSLAIALLSRFASLESTWRAAAGNLETSGLLTPYLENCATLGQQVRIELADGTLTGSATTITPTGELVISSADGLDHQVSAGDVIHLRNPT
jgi:BirA family transcriptional regulator, biotin operon repressor / biotin---[acetyl-CoA-carboxylase] ligase